MGNHQNVYCPVCRRNTKHRILEKVDIRNSAFSEIFQKDRWKCLKCGNVQRLRRTP